MESQRAEIVKMLENTDYYWMWIGGFISIFLTGPHSRISYFINIIMLYSRITTILNLKNKIQKNSKDSWQHCVGFI